MEGHRLFCAGAIWVTAWWAPISVVRADYLTLYGGPSYSSSAGGYKSSGLSGSTTVNDAGTAVGAGAEYDSSGDSLGKQLFSWSASSFTPLETFGTGPNADTTVESINSAGYAVGSADANNLPDNHVNIFAVAWSPSGIATELTDPGGVNSFGGGFATAYAINSSDTAAGSAAFYNGTVLGLGDRAIRWDNSGNPTVLGILSTDPTGYTNCTADGINSSGTVIGAGWVYDNNGNGLGVRAVRWEAGSTAATELGNLGTTLTGSTTCLAGDINDAGTVIGSAEKYDSSGNDLGKRAVRWDAGGTAATELGNLGTSSTGVTTTAATAINSAGTIVGYAVKYDSSGDNLGDRAVLWNASGTAATELGNLGMQSNGVENSQANAINNSGIAVGFADVYDPISDAAVQHGVYWGLDGIAVDLNSLIDPNSGWVLNDAYDISDTGWIDGIGTFTPSNGDPAYQRVFLIDILPEPACGGMLFATAAATMRRKRTAAKR